MASRRLAAIVDSSDDAILSKDLKGKISSWNASAQRIFGYTAEEMIGSSVLRLIPPHLQMEEEEILSRLKRGERIEHYETVRMAKDGRLINVSLTISPIKNSEGTIVGASKIARDITAQKAAEKELRASKEKFQQLWATTTDAIVIIDALGQVQFANPAVQTTFGYSPEKLVQGGLDLIMPERFRGAHHAGLKRYLDTGVKRLNWSKYGNRGHSSRRPRVPYRDFL